MTDFTTRKVIIIVLFMLFSNPLFMVPTYIEEPKSLTHSIDLLCEVDKSGRASHHKAAEFHKKVFDETVEF